jgi:hypothetical protein
MIYWIVVLGGGAVAASGYLLMFPFYRAVAMDGGDCPRGVGSVYHEIAGVGLVFPSAFGRYPPQFKALPPPHPPHSWRQ